MIRCISVVLPRVENKQFVSLFGCLNLAISSLFYLSGGPATYRPRASRPREDLRGEPATIKRSSAIDWSDHWNCLLWTSCYFLPPSYCIGARVRPVALAVQVPTYYDISPKLHDSPLRLGRETANLCAVYKSIAHKISRTRSSSSHVVVWSMISS
jgi:hypothetical protein